MVDLSPAQRALFAGAYSNQGYGGYDTRVDQTNQQFEQARQRQMLIEQMYAQQQAEKQKQNALQQAIAKFSQGQLDPNQYQALRALAAMNPEEALKQYAAGNDPMRGSQLMDDASMIAIQNGARPENAAAAGAADVNRWRAPRPSTVINTGGEFEKTSDRLAAERLNQFYIDDFTAGQKATSTQYDLDQLHALLADTEGGPFEKNVITPFQAVLTRMGVDPSIIGAEKVDRKMAARALENRMVIGLRSPAEGAGMPGHLSDRDVRFLETMPPGLNQTKEGRAMLYQLWSKRLSNTSKLAAYADSIVRENDGRVPSDYTARMTDYKNSADVSFLMDDQGNPTEFGAKFARQWGMPLTFADREHATQAINSGQVRVGEFVRLLDTNQTFQVIDD